MFRLKDHVPYNLVPGVFYEYTYGRCNSSYYGETERDLKVSSGEHIEISLLTLKKTKPCKESSIRDNRLEYNNNPSLMSLPS